MLWSRRPRSESHLVSIELLASLAMGRPFVSPRTAMKGVLFQESMCCGTKCLPRFTWTETNIRSLFKTLRYSRPMGFEWVLSRVTMVTLRRTHWNDWMGFRVEHEHDSEKEVVLLTSIHFVLSPTIGWPDRLFYCDVCTVSTLCPYPMSLYRILSLWFLSVIYLEYIPWLIWTWFYVFPTFIVTAFCDCMHCVT